MTTARSPVMTPGLKAKFTQVFLQSLIVEAEQQGSDEDLLNEGVELYRLLAIKAGDHSRRGKTLTPLEQTAVFAHLHATLTRASRLASIAKKKEGVSGLVKRLASTGKELVEQNLQAGLAGDAAPLALHRPVYRHALLGFPWDDTSPSRAHHTLYDLVNQDPLPDGMSLAVIITGLLMGAPASEFSTLVGLPDDFLENMVNAELNKTERLVT